MVPHVSKGQSKLRKPGPTDDPVAFWAAAWTESVQDAEAAEETSPSAVPAHRKLAREAWREWQAAKAAVEQRKRGKKKTGPDLSLEGQLEVARRMRVAAEAGGSFVAATKLLAEEANLIDAIRERDEAAAKRLRAQRNPDEIMAALVAKIKAMPDSMRAKVRGELGW